MDLVELAEKSDMMRRVCRVLPRQFGDRFSCLEQCLVKRGSLCLRFFELCESFELSRSTELARSALSACCSVRQRALAVALPP